MFLRQLINEMITQRQTDRQTGRQTDRQVRQRNSQFIFTDMISYDITGVSCTHRFVKSVSDSSGIDIPHMDNSAGSSSGDETRVITERCTVHAPLKQQQPPSITIQTCILDQPCSHWLVITAWVTSVLCQGLVLLGLTA